MLEIERKRAFCAALFGFAPHITVLDSVRATGLLGAEAFLVSMLIVVIVLVIDLVGSVFVVVPHLFFN